MMLWCICVQVIFAARLKNGGVALDDISILEGPCVGGEWPNVSFGEIYNEFILYQMHIKSNSLDVLHIHCFKV